MGALVAFIADLLFQQNDVAFREEVNSANLVPLVCLMGKSYIAV